MRRRGAIGLAVALVALAAGAGRCGVATKELKVGDEAPPFELAGSDGRTHSLGEHRGRRVVVLAWFPKAFTGG